MVETRQTTIAGRLLPFLQLLGVLLVIVLPLYVLLLPMVPLWFKAIIGFFVVVVVFGILMHSKIKIKRIRVQKKFPLN